MNEASNDLTELTGSGEIVHDIEGVRIAASEISDPEAFLATDRGKAWFDRQMNDVYFSAWYRDRSDNLESGTVHKLANAILSARQSGSDEHVDTLLEEELGHGACAEDEYHDCGHARRHKRTIAELASGVGDYAADTGIDLPEIDEDLWRETVHDRAIEEMYEKDDSSVLDMVQSHDRFQLIVRLSGGDDNISSTSTWSDWSALCVDRALQTALSRLGHSVSEYRAHSGNRTKSYKLMPGMAKRRPEIASLNQIRSVVDEACSSHFSIVLFAHVKLSDLFELDMTKPVLMTDCWLASYDSMNGTFYDIGLDHSVELLPGHYEMQAATGYTPDSICGLILSHYDADIVGMVEAERMPLPLAA